MAPERPFVMGQDAETAALNPEFAAIVARAGIVVPDHLRVAACRAILDMIALADRLRTGAPPRHPVSGPVWDETVRRE